jgi:hypothetical protein
MELGDELSQRFEVARILGGEFAAVRPGKGGDLYVQDPSGAVLWLGSPAARSGGWGGDAGRAVSPRGWRQGGQARGPPSDRS